MQEYAQVHTFVCASAQIFACIISLSMFIRIFKGYTLIRVIPTECRSNAFYLTYIYSLTFYLNFCSAWSSILPEEIWWNIVTSDILSDTPTDSNSSSIVLWARHSESLQAAKMLVLPPQPMAIWDGFQRRAAWDHNALRGRCWEPVDELDPLKRNIELVRVK